MTVNIAVIGTGQIGSRHLQAMANLEMAATIHLVDIFEVSLKTATDRFFQVYKNHSKGITLECHNDINDLPGKTDLAIIATNSDIRSEIINEICSKKDVGNFILEKILFQTTNEYFVIDDLLQKKNVPTWVNCWMRGKDFYKRLKMQLSLGKNIEMKVDGSNWAMGSSSIHFIDLFAYLTDCNDFDIIEHHLDKQMIASKRKGYTEFSGKLTGRNSKGHSLVLVRDNGNAPYRIHIVNGPQKHEITDCIDHVVHRYFDGEKESIEKVEIPFQSQTTHRLVHQIIDDKCCDLTNYQDSMKFHLPLIRIFMQHLQEVTGKEIRTCPIT